VATPPSVWHDDAVGEKTIGGLPHNHDAERAVLGALLLDPVRISDAAEQLSGEDFFDQRYKLVYELLIELADRNQPVDLLTITTLLRSRNQLAEAGGNAFIAELTTAVASSAHLAHHTDLVLQTANLRRLISEATGVIQEAYTTEPDSESVTDLLDRAEASIFAISRERTTTGAIAIADAMTEAFQRIDAASNRSELQGLRSGFYELDDMLGGFNPGEMTIIAARPSMGKTAFVLNLMERAAMDQREGEESPSVLFFSLEMGRLSIVQRMLCSRAKVDAHKLRTGKIPKEDYADLSRAAGELSGARLFIDDTPGLSIMAIRSRARRVKQNHGLDMIVIDYLQLMTAGGKVESRQQEISQISRQLKELARELEVPLVALSQLSRAVESREDKRPLLSDLRESGSIEQDADVVLMLYRAEYYNPTEENRGKAEVVCAKQRNGPTGSCKLRFFGSILRFENPEPSIAEPILP